MGDAAEPPRVAERRFRLPGPWDDQLKGAAQAQGISVADLLRIIVRDFLRGRYTDAERRLLEGGPH